MLRHEGQGILGCAGVIPKPVPIEPIRKFACPVIQRCADAVNHATAETLGVRLSDFSDALGEKYGVTGPGAVITAITPNSPAQQAGLKVGDLLTRVGKTRVTNAKEAGDALAKIDLSKGVTLHVTNREGSKLVPLQTTK